jgi:hypothetical protein
MHGRSDSMKICDRLRLDRVKSHPTSKLLAPSLTIRLQKFFIVRFADMSAAWLTQFEHAYTRIDFREYKLVTYSELKSLVIHN